MRELRTYGLLLGLVFAYGCAEEPGMMLPPSPTRDASVADGGSGQLEDAQVAPWTDAGEAGTAVANLCDLVMGCRPDQSNTCGGETRCVLGLDGPMCVEASGVAAEGERCDNSELCQAGLACFKENETGAGICGRVCCSFADTTCAIDEVCAGSGLLYDSTRSAPVPTFWGRCRTLDRNCDVLEPSGACETPGEGCYIIDEMGNTQCQPAGEALAGESCTQQSDCASGFFCGMVTQQCVQICSLADDRRPCPEDEQCIAQPHSPASSGFCSAQPEASM